MAKRLPSRSRPLPNRAGVSLAGPMRLVLAVIAVIAVIAGAAVAVAGAAVGVAGAVVFGDYPLSGSVPWLAALVLPLLIGTAMILIDRRHPTPLWLATGPLAALSLPGECASPPAGTSTRCPPPAGSPGGWR